MTVRMLWKTPKGRGSRLLLLDMDFFTNFVSGASPGKSWYQSSGGLGDNWFFGNANPGFAIGGCIMIPPGYAGGGVAARLNVGPPAKGWFIQVTGAGHLNVAYALTSGGFTVLDGGVIAPNTAWPFLVDIYNDGAETVGKLYVPITGNLAHIAAQNTAAAGVFYAPGAVNNTLFTLGEVASAGGDGVFINGLTTEASVSPGGLLTGAVQAFFQGVKDTLTLPVLDGVTSDSYVDATLVYPNAPLTYVTVTPPASDLTQQNSPPSIQNIARTVSFAY